MGITSGDVYKKFLSAVIKITAGPEKQYHRLFLTAITHTHTLSSTIRHVVNVRVTHAQAL